MCWGFREVTETSFMMKVCSPGAQQPGTRARTPPNHQPIHSPTVIGSEGFSGVLSVCREDNQTAKMLASAPQSICTRPHRRAARISSSSPPLVCAALKAAHPGVASAPYAQELVDASEAVRLASRVCQVSSVVHNGGLMMASNSPEPAYVCTDRAEAAGHGREGGQERRLTRDCCRLWCAPKQTACLSKGPVLAPSLHANKACTCRCPQLPRVWWRGALQRSSAACLGT